MAMVSNDVKPMEVAGHFYPADPQACARIVDDCLARARVPDLAVKALIAPHAGYAYSGEIAGSAYAMLAPLKGRIRRVVLLGPAHRYPVRGIAVASASTWATPFGQLRIDWDVLEKLVALPDVFVADQAFTGEHGLEVHLPFIEKVLGPDVSLVPLLVGDASRELVAKVVEMAWGGPETLVLISSDLSHFYDYETASGLDLDACRAIERLRADLVAPHQACGHRPIWGFLDVAKRHDLRATTVDLRNSGDTAGRRDSVVGYAAVGFEYAHSARLPAADRALLLDLARRSMVEGARLGRPPKVAELVEGRLPATLAAVRGTFVTLTRDGDLRGCRGTVAGYRPLIVDVIDNACQSAFGDPRFHQVTAEEIAGLHIEVSILSHHRPIPARSESALIQSLKPDIDGLLIQDGQARALFLPSVWRQLPNPLDFVRHLKMKAGLSATHWSDSFEAYRFTTESFEEAEAGQ